MSQGFSYPRAVIYTNNSKTGTFIKHVGIFTVTIIIYYLSSYFAVMD